MDNDRFDKLSRMLASGLTRRRALKGIAASALAGLAGLPRRIGAQEDATVEAVEAAANDLLNDYVWDKDDPFDAQTHDLLVRISGARSLAAADQEALAAEVEALAQAYYGYFGGEDENGVDQGGGDVAVVAAIAIHPRWRCIRRCIWRFLLCLLGCHGRPLCRLWCLIKFIRCLRRCRLLAPAPIPAIAVPADAGA